MAADFVEWAFREDELLAITMLPSGLALSSTRAEMSAALREQGLDGLVYGGFVAEKAGRRARGSGMDDDGVARQGVYFSVGALNKRVKKKPADVDVAHMGLVCQDLDANKPGAFRGWGHIIEAVSWLDRQGIGPQAVIATGSGGAHLHWRFDTPLGVDKGRETGQRLAALLRSQFDVSVDSVHEPSRLMRLPGSVRWPKRGELGGARSVETVRLGDGWANADVLMRATQTAWDSAVRNATRQRDKANQDWADLSFDAADLTALGVDPDAWSGRYVVATVQEAFNAEVSWARILEPLGWTKHEVDSKGRVWWTRPHDGGESVNPRSAAVDWPESPNVMSLQTSSERTGLAHLRALNDTLRAAGRQGAPLTKVRVAAELWRGGDVGALMREFLARKVGELGDVK